MNLIRTSFHGLVLAALGAHLACNGGIGDNATTPTSAPTISGFSTNHSQVSNTVDIYGTYLTGATAVSFNGIPAKAFTVVSATDISAEIPVTASTGKISITTPGGTVTSSATFGIDPAITAISPATGPAGTSVTLTGSGFLGATRLTFGAKSSTAHAAVFSVLSANEITAAVPADAITGNVYLTASEIVCTGPVFTVN